MSVGTADYTIQNLNEKTNAEIEGFLKKSKEKAIYKISMEENKGKGATV